MNRRQFLQLAAAASVSSYCNATNKQMFNALNHFPDTPKMPVLFLGHGSPMNAIEDSEFTRDFISLAKKLPRPNAILCISAHWQSQGSWLTAMSKPKTIHDFYGFPKALYDVEYQAPGSIELAESTKSLLSDGGVKSHLDHHEWGLDHGTWSVLTHLYPEADIPVVQLSLDHYKNPRQHYELAKLLKVLRQKGILIVGSGNIVHNLGMLSNTGDNVVYGYDWALEADHEMKKLINQGDHRALINYQQRGKAFELAIPTPEHYLPLIYTLALQDKKDSVVIFNDKAVEGSITMTSIALGV